MSGVTRRSILATSAVGFGAGLGARPWQSAKAQAANTIRIGVLTDMSGTYRDNTGPTSAACTRIAAQEIAASRGLTVEVIEADPGYDGEGLRQRLAAEAPGAVLDDHTRWRRPLAEAAARLRLLGWVAIVLIGATMAAMITLAANASLAANAQVIRVLRLVGAKDSYIARAFVRRFTLRALTGAAAGALAGLIGVALLPSADAAGGFLTGLGFTGAGWLLPFVLPPLVAAVAFAATRRAAFQKLRELP